MNDYIQFANLALNVLLLPLLVMQWKAKVDLATVSATITALSGKIDVADAEIKQLRQRMHDALNYIAEIKGVIELRKRERKDK